MKLTPIFYPYRIYSEGASVLAKELDTWLVYPNRNYIPKKRHLVICWGAGTYPNWWKRVPPTQVLNSPGHILTAINKLRTFEAFKQLGISCPPWTTRRDVAVDWQSQGHIVVCRSSLTSSEGRGIVVADKTVKLPHCYLYTKHIRHKREFRVHVFKGTVIDVTEKRKRDTRPKNISKLDRMIRSWRHGFVFCHEDVDCPKEALNEAIRAVKGLQLDFGAVDIGFREKESKPYVFEVNTAPGIEGRTIQRYADAIRQVCN